MQKFRFSKSNPAKVAKPAKAPINKGNPIAKPLLTIAKVDGAKQNISNFSKTLASQEPFKINYLSNISNISKGQGINLKKQSLQDELNYIWGKAWNLAEWVDNENSTVDYRERKKFVPEIFKMSAKISELEKQIAQNQEVNHA